MRCQLALLLAAAQQRGRTRPGEPTETASPAERTESPAERPQPAVLVTLAPSPVVADTVAGACTRTSKRTGYNLQWVRASVSTLTSGVSSHPAARLPEQRTHGMAEGSAPIQGGLLDAPVPEEGVDAGLQGGGHRERAVAVRRQVVLLAVVADRACAVGAVGGIEGQRSQQARLRSIAQLSMRIDVSSRRTAACAGPTWNSASVGSTEALKFCPAFMVAFAE